MSGIIAIPAIGVLSFGVILLTMALTVFDNFEQLLTDGGLPGVFFGSVLGLLGTIFGPLLIGLFVVMLVVAIVPFVEGLIIRSKAKHEEEEKNVHLFKIDAILKLVIDGIPFLLIVIDAFSYREISRLLVIVILYLGVLVAISVCQLYLCILHKEQNRHLSDDLSTAKDDILL